MFFVTLIWSFVILFTFEAKLTATTPEAIKDSITKASLYLRTYGQEPDGSFSPQSGPAITALVAAALVRTGTSADSPMEQLNTCLRFNNQMVESISGNQRLRIMKHQLPYLLFMSAILLGAMTR